MTCILDLQCLDLITDVNNYPEFHNFLKAVSKTDEERYLFANVTKMQAESDLWKRARLFRVTASVCVEVAKLFNNPLSWVGGNLKSQLQKKAKQMCVNHMKAFMNLSNNNNNGFNSAACQYGINNESQARAVYLKRNPHLFCKETGIVLSNSGGLGASPDGILYRSKRAMKDPLRWKEGELLEIKCPFNCRDIGSPNENQEQIREKIINKCKYLEWKTIMGERKITLNLEDPQGLKYYHQVQMGMYVSDLLLCHFVIWNKNICFSFGISFDQLWKTTASNLNYFWKMYLMPELFQHKLGRIDEEEEAGGQTAMVDTSFLLQVI